MRHYTIEVIPRGEILSMTFAPGMGPKDWRDRTLGGRTQYGIAVNYDVSLKTLKIVKTSSLR